MDNPTTPAPSGRLKSMFRSILRDKNTPSTGQSVRWDGRDAYRTITPNTSATSTEGVPTTPLLEDEESTSFLDRLQNDSNDDKAGKIDQLAAMGRSVGSRFTTSPSTTPPQAGPSTAPKSSLPPIPRPRFGPSAPSTSSPLSRDDSSLSFPYSVSPAPDQLPSHRPFDMSCEMDSIPNIAEDGSGLAYDTSAPNADEDGTTFVSAADMSSAAVEDETQRNSSRATVEFPVRFSPGKTGIGAPGRSIRGMTTMYPPGMYNFTKSRVNNPIPSFSVDLEPEHTPRTRRRDTTGSSSLDFIISPSASDNGRPRTSLPPRPLPPFDPPPVPTSSRTASARPVSLSMLQSPDFSTEPKPSGASLARSNSYSNMLSKATTTKMFQASARELPTLYPPGGFQFDPTQVDPDNIPELSQFFPPAPEPENSQFGVEQSTVGDVSRASVTIGHRGHRPTGSVGSVSSRKSLFLAADSSSTSLATAAAVPLPPSTATRSRPNSIANSISSASSLSISASNPNSLADLTHLIESQYKADLAAHTALVPILLSRAESAEASAQRLAGVVKDAKNRVKDLERLCGELGTEVGLLKQERGALVAERDQIASERDGLKELKTGLEGRLGDMSTERESLIDEIGNLSMDLDTLAQAQTARGVLDLASGEAMREMHVQLRNAEKEAARSRRRKEERDDARARLKELQAHFETLENQRQDWSRRRGGLETEVRDLEVKVERERDGASAREAFALEREQWEKERVALLDRCVRAEQARDEAGSSEAEVKLRRQLDEYKAEVESQWKYAEQADATIKALEADVAKLRKRLEKAPSGSSSSNEAEWKRKEEDWERQKADWAEERSGWEGSEAVWVAERARIESRHVEMKAEMGRLQEDIRTLIRERDTLHVQLEGVKGEAGADKMRGEMEKMEAEMNRMDEDMAALAERARHAEELYASAQEEAASFESKVQDLENRLKNSQGASEDLTHFENELERLEAERADLEAERNELLDGIDRAERQMKDMEDRARQLEERCARAEKDRVEVIKDRAEIEDEMERLRVEVEDVKHERTQYEQERDVLAEELTSEQEALTALEEEHKQLATRLQETEREHQIALDKVQRLERVISARNEELAQTEESVRIQAREADQLRSSTRELEQIKTQLDDALQAEEHLRAELEEAQKLHAAESAELASLRARSKQFGDETTKLQKRLNELMTESADKEVRIVQLNKARAQDLEDKEGLNAALQAKQQELELIKRKLGVKGTAGATPAPSRMQRASYSRRESTASSLAFETPLPRAMVRKESVEQIPSSDTASVLSSSIASNPLQTSSRVNIYGSTPEPPTTSTPSTVKPARRMPDQVPPRSSMRIPSHSRLSSLSVSSIRGVHFAPSESTESETEASDVTVQL